MDRLENKVGVIINPATEDTQELVALLLSQLKFQGDGLQTTQAVATSGVLSSVEVDDLTTLLVDTTPNRAALIVATTDTPIYIGVDMQCSNTHYCFRLPKNAIWEFKGYVGPLWACTPSGITQINVTEFIL